MIGSQAFPRIRFGVGKKPHPDYDLADWVLGNFSKEDKACLTACFGTAYDGLCKILCSDVEGAMQICNMASTQSKKA
jgi:PTH1 family peptidyl-tRNA hydrolase